MKLDRRSRYCSNKSNKKCLLLLVLMMGGFILMGISSTMLNKYSTQMMTNIYIGLERSENIVSNRTSGVTIINQSKNEIQMKLINGEPSSNPSKQSDRSPACVLPKLDPYDPLIKKHIHYMGRSNTTCPIIYHGDIQGETLVVRSDTLSYASFAYVRREANHDSRTHMSGWTTMTVTFNQITLQPGINAFISD